MNQLPEAAQSKRLLLCLGRSNARNSHNHPTQWRGCGMKKTSPSAGRGNLLMRIPLLRVEKQSEWCRAVSEEWHKDAWVSKEQTFFPNAHPHSCKQSSAQTFSWTDCSKGSAIQMAEQIILFLLVLGFIPNTFGKLTPHSINLSGTRLRRRVDLDQSNDGFKRVGTSTLIELDVFPLHFHKFPSPHSAVR